MRDLNYLLAYSIPLSAFFAIYFQGIFSFSSLIYAFFIIPLLELILPESNRLYPEDDKESRLKNVFFDLLLYLNVPIVFGLLAYGLLTIYQDELLTYELIGIISSLGVLLATNAINVAHELGHRSSLFERTLSKILYLPCLYMHFYLEHNFGHHKNVATEKDPASAKHNQSLYSFWVTSVLNQYENAWNLQMKFLAKEGRTFFSFKNDMLFYLIFQAAYLTLVYLLFGSFVFLVAIMVGINSFLYLETINYIEHYGLKRTKLASGSYERVSAIHSWNSNHTMGRMVLYELTRHSDHHHKASKKYQVLEHKEESPQLPFGYPTSMIIALIPPLWFRLMNPRIPTQMLADT
jgi:alkane 1-monooxygenase